jgi:hypothetical protein
VEALASRDEIACLDRLRDMTSLIFFVRTKIDLVDSEQWQKWRDRNLQIITEHLKMSRERVQYFPVSAEIKKIADKRRSPKYFERSGFNPLLYFLNHKLLKLKGERKARSLLDKITFETAAVRRRLSDEIRVLDSKTKEETDKLQNEFLGKKIKLEKWKTEIYPHTITRFQEKSNDLKRKTMEDFQKYLDPSPQGKIIAPLIDDLRRSDLGAKQLSKEVSAIQSNCIDQCSQEIFQIQGHFNKEMKRLINRTCAQLGKSFPLDHETNFENFESSTAENLNIYFSIFEEARNALYGGMAGGMMANLAAGLIFPPAGAAMLVAQVIGVIGGVFATSRNLKARRKEEALAKLEKILIDTVRKAQQQARNQFQDIAVQLERAADDAFKNAYIEFTHEIEERLRGIEESKKRTFEENRERALQQRKVLDAADHIFQSIGLFS